MMDWLFRWRHPVRVAAPYRSVDMSRVAEAADAHRDTARATVRSAVDRIEMQQSGRLMERMLSNADALRDLTNDTLDRTKR